MTIRRTPNHRPYGNFMPRLLAFLVCVATLSALPACGTGALAPTESPTQTVALSPTFTTTPSLSPTPTEPITPTETAAPPTPTADAQLATAVCEQPRLPTLGRKQVYAPILLYHHIGSDNYEQDGIYDSRYNVTIAEFNAQLDLLRSLGYQTVRTAAISDAITGHGTLPARPIVISFDDGWEDQYQNAFPALREHGFAGAFFIPSTYPDATGFVTWSQLAEMASAGMEIGSHSRTHPHLTKIPEGQAWIEIRNSKVDLEKRLKVTVDAFSYPFGEMGSDGTIPTQVSRALYKAAVGVEAGSLQNEFFYLRRTEIFGSMTNADFIRALPWRGQGTSLCP
jgi:peptidoglycan/xylan/chitin deacetylase (PgdA/CDA1 family)